jgi:hypothetical protein
MRPDLAQVHRTDRGDYVRLEDRELAARIAREVGEAFARGMAQDASDVAARGDEPEPERAGRIVTEIGTVHALEIGEDGARRYGWID